MFLGIPVMISDVDGSGKIINQFKNGFVLVKKSFSKKKMFITL